MKSSRMTGLFTLVVLGAIGIGCSSSSKEAGSTPETTASTPQKKDPVLYTGKNCLSEISYYASKWQPDALPVHLESVPNSEDNGQDGKATVWTGTFASASRASYKVFTCSGSRLKDAPPSGVTAGSENASPPEIARNVFQPILLIVDSDAAFAAAQPNGGAALIKKDPQQPVMYTLDWDSKGRQLDWVVIFGASRADSKGLGVIDASTGKFLRGGK
jgi:hypothetical protein